MRIPRRLVAAAGLSALLCLAFEPALLAAWAPDTHVHLAREVLEDAVSDGRVTVHRIVDGTTIAEPVGRYRVDPAILASLRAHPDHFLAGVVGPDAYPDILTGQRLIHPDVAEPVETPWEVGRTPDGGGTSASGTDAWLSHLWKRAFPDADQRDPSAWKAFVTGFLVHAAGDLYAHTYVNEYAGGPFELGENGLRHFVLESYIGTITPGAGDRIDAEIARAANPMLRSMVVAGPGTDLDERLLVGEDAGTSIPRIFSTVRANLQREIDAHEDLSVPERAATGAAHAYRVAWLEDVDDGLRAWPRLSHQVARQQFYAPDGYDPLEAGDQSLGDWVGFYTNNHLLSMAGLPDFVGETVQGVSDIVDAIVPDPMELAIREMRDDLLDYLFEQAIGISYRRARELGKDPGTYFDQVLGGGTTGRPLTRDELVFEQLDMEVDDPAFDYRVFPPAYNTVVLTKLALLGRDELDRLLADLGSDRTVAVPNVMLGFVRSLDGDNQWLDGPQMAFARDPTVYRQIFMTQIGERGGEGSIGGTVVVDSVDATGADVAASQAGRPLEGAEAAVFRVDDDGGIGYLRSAFTGPDGAYRVGWLEPGRYRVRFSAPGFEGEWWEDMSRDGALPVGIRAQRPAVGGIDAALAPAGRRVAGGGRPDEPEPEPAPTPDPAPDEPEPGPGPGPGIVWGDVHLRTLDGRSYDLQAAGEFVMAAAPGDGLEVQVRMVPYGERRSVSVTTAVAARVAGRRVTLAVDRDPVVWVDGRPAVLGARGGERDLGRGALVRRRGRRYELIWPDGSRLEAGVGTYIDVRFLPAPSRAGELRGLLGDFDGDRTDDLVLGDGRVLDDPSVEVLHGPFADAWRVTPAGSLFDYGPGESTAAFTDRSMPRRAVSAATLPAADRRRAEAVCRAAGVQAGVALEACVLDVGLTGESAFARSSRFVQRDGGAATLDAPVEVMAGAAFEVLWSGPGGEGDYLAVAAPEAPVADYDNRAWANTNPVSLVAPAEPGRREIRYVRGRPPEVLARLPLTVTPARASLEAAGSVAAGARLSVTWSGPGGERHMLTVARADQPGPRYVTHRWLNTGDNPIGIRAPDDPGTYQLRYVTPEGRVLARQPLTVTPR